VKMGAKVEKGRFEPGHSDYYGAVIKGINVPILGYLLVAEKEFDVTQFMWFLTMVVLVGYLLFKLVKPREYIRAKELRNMSIMEILTIYTLVPLVLPWLEASILMLFGIIYFLTANHLLWGVSYPRV